jgi:DNA-directed RNA polymerase sigma subunit (sigma70/sigma32)
MANHSKFSLIAVRTVEEVAIELSKVEGKRVTRARIQQIEKRALEKLAIAARAAGLDEAVLP